MGGLPKKKVSRSRRGMRRSHDRIRVPPLTMCPHCRQPMVTHQVCTNCGMYNGHQIYEPKTNKPESKSPGPNP